MIKLFYEWDGGIHDDIMDQVDSFDEWIKSFRHYNRQSKKKIYPSYKGFIKSMWIEENEKVIRFHHFRP